MQAYTFDMTQQWPQLSVLELFVAVIEHGSLGAGARATGVAQPNASRAIAELEARLGAPLLIRHPRGSRPTPLGLELAGRARDLLTQAAGLTEWIAHGTGPQHTECRITASMTIAETLLPTWIAEARRRSPQTLFHITVANSRAVLDALQRGQADLGFVETPEVPVGVNTHVVHEDELVIAVPPHHPWARHTTDSPVTLAELAETPLVVREHGSGTREAIDALLSRKGAQLIVEQELSSNAAVRVAGLSGAGPIALSELALSTQLRDGSLVRVTYEGQGTPRPLTAAWIGPHQLTGIASELVQIARGVRPI